ncbi:hypothetical protein PI125_g4520 [Phytophthora idaei]|nr:hypothetical protein PI125_g4520 [Phytophthora idaei]
MRILARATKVDVIRCSRQGCPWYRLCREDPLSGRVPMIVVFVLSAVWTFTLAYIQVHATEMANSVMNTTHFDNGEFWLLPHPDDAIVISSAIVLSLFGIGYTGLIATMLFPLRLNRRADAIINTAPSNEVNSAVDTGYSKNVRDNYFTAALDLPKLIFQTTTLTTYLSHGFPTPIVYLYSVLLLCNWLVACYRSQRYVADPKLIIARLYYTMTCFFAVFAPLVVLIYFILSFQFDRAEFATKMETIQVLVRRLPLLQSLVFADRQTAPRTYSEWTNPEDTTSKLAELAYAGELRIVQIINRSVPELPEELRKCHHLQQLILVYTKTQRLPEWMSEFSQLEYFHVEGDTSKRLQIVPAGIFDHMPHLTFIHFGGIPDVEELPSFSSLGKLRYLTLAILNSLKEILSFEGLSKLTALNIVEATRAKTLPSLTPLVSLKSLGLHYRTGVCCNGYLTGTCDTISFQCVPKDAEKYPMTCTTDRASNEDKAILNMNGETEICPNSFAYDLESAAPTKHTSDDLCGSVLYKNCTLNGVQGICYNTRMMVICCVTQPAYITMRQLQIERKVGKPCNVTVEAWLGCT